jgi:hypothetical protein
MLRSGLDGFYKYDSTVGVIFNGERMSALELECKQHQIRYETPKQHQQFRKILESMYTGRALLTAKERQCKGFC